MKWLTGIIIGGLLIGSAGCTKLAKGVGAGTSHLLKEIADPSQSKSRKKIECHYCDGTGVETCLSCDGTGRGPFGLRCITCKGRGLVKCSRCDGRGYIKK